MWAATEGRPYGFLFSPPPLRGRIKVGGKLPDSPIHLQAPPPL